MDECRKQFEAWITDDGKWSKAAERSADGEGYKLLQSAICWTAWYEAWNRRAMLAIPAGYALPSRVADLLHLLEFAEITTPSTGDGEQAQKAMADIRAMLEAAPQQDVSQEDKSCNPHPDAPHGFDRNASHNAGRYVCECEGWQPVAVQDPPA